MPEFDIYCPLMSLPFVLGTTLDTIPAEVPYLHPDLADIERWRNRFTPDDRRLRVGLVWGGNPAHRNERNRSIMLRMLTPIGGDPRVAFYSLQKGPPAAQAADAKKFGIDLTDWTAELNDFADTAALIHHLDLVITVDTSVAHLAGALAKPTWVLLPTPADFRWMLERSDSPWYPTMRLFRQPRPRDWETPIQKVAAELRSLAARSVHHVGGE
jgi:hypothetical protein